MQNAVDWARARWAQLRRDVWDDPSIGPVAGILLSALALLIVWLTIEYAPGAADCVPCGCGVARLGEALRALRRADAACSRRRRRG